MTTETTRALPRTLGDLRHSEWSEARVKERYNWLFEYNVDTVEV